MDKTYVSLFSDAEDVHLTKDIGMIPYMLYKNYGYDSYLACHKNGAYPSLKTETEGLKLWFIKKNFPEFVYKYSNLLVNFFIDLLPRNCTILHWKLRCVWDIIKFEEWDAFIFMLKNAKKIDILQIMGCKIPIMLLYKLLKKDGILYLKLDLNSDELVKEIANKKQLLLLSWSNIINPDIISVESRAAFNAIKKSNNLNLRHIIENISYLPNGIDIDKINWQYDANKKENIILYTGRIQLGNPKRTEIVLDTFIKISNEFPDWKLILTGMMDSNFSKIFEEAKHINKNIIYAGYLKKNELYEYYKKAKIYFLPSSYEGFSLATIEAGYFGDVILASDLVSVKELTNNGKYGEFCKIEDTSCFEKKLKKIVSDNSTSEKSKKLHEYVKLNYNWDITIKKLDKLISQKINEKTRKK